MQSNLDSAFKTNKDFEDAGIWMEVSDTTKFLIRRFGGYNSPRVKLAMAKYYKPFAKQIENNTLSQSKQDEINAKVFIESCLADWAGVEIDGSPVPYSTEAALKILLNLPDLLSALIEHSTALNNYKDDLGNF